jgi:putative nucleotidyltransferase with HDIG domain
MHILMRWLNRFKLLNHDQYIRITLFALLGIVMFAAMFSNIQPEKVNINLYSKASKDILAPITMEDKEATIQKEQEALAKVEDQYTLKADYAQNRIEIISGLFDAVSEVNEMEQQTEQNTTEETEKEQQKTLSIEEKLKLLSEKIPNDYEKQLSSQVFIPLLEASPEQLDTAKSTTITSVRKAMKERIKIGDEEEKKLQVRDEINNVNLNSELRASMSSIAQYAIIPNYVYDVSGTEELRQQAIDEVSPVVIRAGQVLAKEGQVIDREIYRQIEIVGLLDQETPVTLFIGLALFVILLSAVTSYFFKGIHSRIRSENTYLLIYLLIFSSVIALMKVISLFQQFYTDIGYVVPVAMATMLIKMLINERMAILTSIVLAFCSSIIFNVDVFGNFNYPVAIYSFFSAIAGVLFLEKQNHRSKILKAGLFISFINVFVLLTLFLLMKGNFSLSDLGFYVILAVGSGIISAILTLGLMPFFEAGFGMLSTMKLIELANPNHPLLRKILTEAPGTYHHSIMVANLAEAACESIGADGFLARVGSYYHDLGKTKRPHFFIENQMNMENPHDKIAPQLSKTIITAHPYDGAKVLKEYKLPQEIVDIAEQHHGTTLLKFFYHKAKEMDKQVTEGEFRYPGPKAQTKESAIVGIADSVEAAVRSLRNPTPNKIETIVRNIISDRLQDGQFDECDLTLKELDQAAKSMCETLKGIFHSRIEYPEIVKKKVKEA